MTLREEHPGIRAAILTHGSDIHRISPVSGVSCHRNTIGEIKIVDMVSINTNITKEVDKANKSKKEGEKLSVGEFSYVQGFVSEFGTAKAREFAGSKMHIEDTDDGYNLSESTFKLASEPIKGIENIDTYNPNRGRVQVLYAARSGNSGTLEDADVEKIKAELAKIPETDKTTPDALARRSTTAQKIIAPLFVSSPIPSLIAARPIVSRMDISIPERMKMNTPAKTTDNIITS